jgi:hypothetical protein
MEARLVVHCKRDRFDVYIGRPGPWGNPFSHLPDSAAQFRCASREEAVARYREWLLSQSLLVEKAKRELRGKVLGCWCAPKSCHGEVLAEVANSEPDHSEVTVQITGSDWKGRPFCAGLVFRGDVCVATAPILRRDCRGKTRAEVRVVLKAKRWKAQLATL